MEELIDYSYGNKLIAEFMGYKVERVTRQHMFDKNKTVVDYKAFHNEQLIFSGVVTPEIVTSEIDVKTRCWDYIAEIVNYNSSWDWLMPVVEKMEGIIADNDEAIHHIEEAHYIGWGNHEIWVMPYIDKVYGEVIQFIEWYNDFE